MATRLFGIETEYAFAALGPHGRGLGREGVLDQFFQLARDRLTHLPGHGCDIYLANGSRFYVDCGLHPEMCTPECANPWDVVRYVKAGEQILGDLADELVRQEEQLAAVYISKSNVDYSGTKSTWGCHESYLHRCDPQALPPQLLPFLVSRLIYTGSGGFDTGSGGLEFMVSPRVAHLHRAISSESTADRGIFHTKDESLSACGYHRLHLLCGEGLSSERALWLRVGTTALVVALIESGGAPGEGVALRAPLAAMGRFARDPACTADVEASDGRPLTALGIQRHYLAHAEAHVHAPWMPPWAEQVCHTWRETLERLEQAPDAVATSLDWAIKHALYRNHLRRRGLDQPAASHWSHVVRVLSRALAETPHRNSSVPAELVLGPASPIPDAVGSLKPYLDKHGLTWDGLRPFLTLRQELSEIDSRFGQIGGQSIFDALDRAGVLTHHVQGVDNVQHARDNPPATGRARVRGECIRRTAGQDGRHICCWDCIIDPDERRRLDLSDPFEDRERWEPMSHGAEGEIHILERMRSLFGTRVRPAEEQTARMRQDGGAPC